MAGVIKSVLFVDFDNTITIGDVLDAVIERFSATEQWRDWESDWQRGELTTAECLSLQVRNLRVDAEELAEFVSGISIDACFSSLVDLCAARRIPLRIVSDNFSLIVREILRRHSLPDVTVYANELHFDGNKPVAMFPHANPQCGRCAHCKAGHFAAFASHRKIFVGDGLSDLCPAEAADIVFAKGALARHLSSAGTPFIPFASLGDVFYYLEMENRHRHSIAAAPTSSGMPGAR